MGRVAPRARVRFAAALAAVLGGLVLAAPRPAAAQAQEAIEIGRLEVEDARTLLGCFRTYLRETRNPGAEARLRACATAAHGRVTTVTVAAIRDRLRGLAIAAALVALLLRRAETHGANEALDEARAALAQVAAERSASPPPAGTL